MLLLSTLQSVEIWNMFRFPLSNIFLWARQALQNFFSDIILHRLNKKVDLIQRKLATLETENSIHSSVEYLLCNFESIVGKFLRR